MVKLLPEKVNKVPVITDIEDKEGNAYVVTYRKEGILWQQKRLKQQKIQKS